jgi:hypothetical protein
MLCSRPAVVTDVGGNAELCVDGETGFVATAPAISLLEQTLERAWNYRHEWQRIGAAARIRAERLIPSDPIGDFCCEILECTPSKSNSQKRSGKKTQKPVCRQTHGEVVGTQTSKY